ncbi:MAG: Ig-like domain-containing protein, partial [Muribaculum sp.]|nr:Ig-like domain-containing protein [Muribaculum sp.]
YTPDAGADYSFELLQLNMCANDDNIALIGFEGGEDIKSYKWATIPGRYAATAGNLNIIAEDGRDIEQGIYNIDLGNEAGWVSIFVVGLNDAGEVAAGDVLYFYNFAHNPEDWTSIGNVQFTDDTFGSVYGIDDAIAPIKVEMLESKTTPGLYRLVNPYATHKLAEEYEGAIECHFDHNHYIDIDASDIENVTISEVPIGITIYGEEHITLFSDKPGTLVDNKITFPKRGLGVGIFGGEEEGYYYANHAGRFAVELPCTLNVKAFDTNDNPVEGAYVYAGSSEAITDENGEAKMELFGVIGKTVAVTVMKDYMFWEGTADFTEGETAYVFPVLEEPTCTLTVRAVTADYDPVEGAYVMVNGEEKVTGENGAATFTLEGVIGKTLPVTVMKDYMFWEGSADFTEGMEATVIAILEEPACTLTVRAVTADYDPVEGAYVMVNGEEKVTGENGAATFTL